LPSYAGDSRLALTLTTDTVIAFVHDLAREASSAAQLAWMVKPFSTAWIEIVIAN
jgi:hypothetical protein